VAADIESDEELDVLERAKKRRKTIATTTESSAYLSLKWIPPTSNVVERLFSRMRITLGHLRKSMSPMRLEGIMFLHSNSDLWDVSLVNDLVKSKFKLRNGC